MTLLDGRYTIEKPLGEGGMGVVYRGLDSKTETPVAIKKLRPDTLDKNPQAIERFNREAQALRDLNHPNIVKAYSAFQQNGDHYIVMEFVEGSDLQNLMIQEGRLALARVVRIGIELSDALTRAHYLRIIHRDLKPANVLIDRNGTPKLSDFGVAYLESQERVTGMGVMVGTPAYMAPEILNGKVATERSDLWALGVMLYEMMAAKHPFRGENLSELLINVMTQPVPDLEDIRPDCPIALADLIYRLLERNPDARISSARIVGIELEQLLRGLETQSVRATDVMPEANAANTPSAHEQRTIILKARNNLPAQTTPFIGRERELSDLARLIADPDSRLITVLGAGGMGKTRLAIAAAAACLSQDSHAFEHGVFLVELAPLTSAEPLLTTLANAIGFQFGSSGQPLTQLSDYLREKRMLLLLDNFEHVLTGASVVNELLRAAGRVKIIVTSREKLNLSGENLYTLDGLDLPDADAPDTVKTNPAAQLFIQSAARARLGYTPTESDLALISQICHAVGGLPLGIVLAASWVQTLSLQEVLDEIRRGLDFLETEMGDVPERHRSIRAVFAYSWALMSEDERALIAKLSVFRGGLSRRAAQEVAGAALRPLAGLVNKSLLRRDPDVGSYHMHELLRQYAERKLEESGKAAEVRAAHSRYYLGVLAELRPSLEGGAQVDTLRKIADDIENVRAAWGWAVNAGDITMLTMAMRTLNAYFELRGQFFEGEALFQHTITGLRQQPVSPSRDELIGEMLARQAVMAVAAHHHDAVDQLLEDSAALLHETSSPLARAALAFAHGFTHLTLKKVTDSFPYFEQAATLYRVHGERWALAQVLDEWSSAYWYRADFQPEDLAQARKLLSEALIIQQSLGDIYGQATTTMHLGTVASYALDDAEDARLTHESLTLFQQIGHTQNVSRALNNMGVRELINGNYEAARAYLEKALYLRRDLGGKASIAWALYVMSRLCYSEGKFTEGLTYADEGLTLLTGGIHLEREVMLLGSRGELHLAQGSYSAAQADYQRLGEIAAEQESAEDALNSLLWRGVAALFLRDDANAKTWLTQAQTDAQAADDKTIDALAQTYLARLALLTGDASAAQTLMIAPIAYFTDKAAWQMSYNNDPWLMSAYTVTALMTQAETAYVLNQPDLTRTALSAALKAAQAIRSPAHILSVCAAYADLIEKEQARFATALAARVATHASSYAADKTRAQTVLSRTAVNPALTAESFAQACLDGETLPLEAVMLPMIQALS